jgi:DNA-binding MarR family transcriptional regulator
LGGATIYIRFVRVVEVDAAVELIEESVVAIVREASLPRLQEWLVAEAGVSVERAGYQVLRAVAEQPSVRLGDLARQLGLDTSTVSRHVKGLQGAGLVGRSGDPGDGRVARLELTDAGAEALGRLRRARHQFFAEILVDWPQGDRELLAPLLVRLAHDVMMRGEHRR